MPHRGRVRVLIALTQIKPCPVGDCTTAFRRASGGHNYAEFGPQATFGGLERHGDSVAVPRIAQLAPKKVAAVVWIILHIQLGRQQVAAPQSHLDMDVGCPAAVRHRADGTKGIATVGTDDLFAEPLECRVGPGAVTRMVVVARSIALPDFDLRPCQWLAARVGDASFDPAGLALAIRLCAIAQQVCVVVCRKCHRIERAFGLARRGSQASLRTRLRPDKGIAIAAAANSRRRVGAWTGASGMGDSRLRLYRSEAWARRVVPLSAPACGDGSDITGRETKRNMAKPA